MKHQAAKELKTVGTYQDCPSEVYEVLDSLLAHEFPSLDKYAYRLIFTNKISFKKGRRTLATIKIQSDRDRLVSGIDIVIVIERKYWIEHPNHQQIILFHELCHLSHSDDEERHLVMVGHDIEEFQRVWLKFGDWRNEMAEKTIEQLSLDLKIKRQGGLSLVHSVDIPEKASV